MRKHNYPFIASDLDFFWDIDFLASLFHPWQKFKKHQFLSIEMQASALLGWENSPHSKSHRINGVNKRCFFLK